MKINKTTVSTRLHVFSTVLRKTCVWNGVFNFSVWYICECLCVNQQKHPIGLVYINTNLKLKN